MTSSASSSNAARQLEKLCLDLCPLLHGVKIDAPPAAALDPEKLRPLLEGSSPGSDLRPCFPQAAAALERVAHSSPEQAERLAARRLDALRQLRDTQKEVTAVLMDAFSETFLPVVVGGRIVHCLSTGPILRTATSGRKKNTATLSADKGTLPLDEVAFDSIIAMYRRLADLFRSVIESEMRSAQLAGRLIQSERARSLGSLSPGIAHHFNNLLSVILGYASYAANREDLPAEIESPLEKIIAAALRGRRLTDDLLAFAGGETAEETPCPVNQTIAGVLSLLASQSPSGIVVRENLSAAHDYVMAIPGDLHQIVFNLLSNAFDSMPGGGHLKVETTNILVDTPEGRREHLRIEVSDSSGIPPEGSAAADLTPPETTKLSSVFGLVGRLEGHLSVSSQPGAGTSVEVLLPVVPHDQGPLPPTRTGQAPPRPARIWIVDDDVTFREMCRVVLSEEGHEVVEFADGRDLQKRWRKIEQPDVIIVDFSMPEFNGLELCEWLGQQGSKVPVILVSGLSPDTPDIHKAMQRKKTYFIQKPFSFRELSELVTMALSENIVAGR